MSNRINWPVVIIQHAARYGFRPFAGCWVRRGDARLYTLEEVLQMFPETAEKREEI